MSTIQEDFKWLDRLRLGISGNQRTQTRQTAKCPKFQNDYRYPWAGSLASKKEPPSGPTSELTSAFSRADTFLLFEHYNLIFCRISKLKNRIPEKRSPTSSNDQLLLMRSLYALPSDFHQSNESLDNVGQVSFHQQSSHMNVSSWWRPFRHITIANPSLETAIAPNEVDRIEM